ncbi:aspartyl protease family protein [Qipengyuania mesophila]|uniref:aspartyl protease family protein n=2 Tax=Qipengyuania mesophila TaxID=2867246 RepID=UPI0035159C09
MFVARYFASAMAACALPLASTPASASSEASDSACALAVEAPSEALVSLPFRTIDGRIYLEAMVNGAGPFVFALDTGASGVGRADASLVEELALPPDGEDETSDGVSSAVVDKVRIDSLAFGALERHDVSLIARDYRSRMSAESAFSGILGREFFADGLLAIDFPAKRVNFYRSREMHASQPGAMSYERAFRIPVTLGDLETTGNVDTGANVTLVLPGPVYDEVDGTSLTPAGDASLTNTRIASSKARLAGPVQIGGARLDDVPVRVVPEYPEVLVGAHALQDHVLLIDQRHKTLALCPPAAP